MWYHLGMNFEIPAAVNIEVESDFADFVPEAFKVNPIAYFEAEGRNIKSGEVRYHVSGSIDEDPTAVKDLPIWANTKGQTLAAVAKRVNIEKAQIRETADPFYEYRVMELAQELGLPAPRPIAKVEQSGAHLIVMERISGLRWVHNDMKYIRELGYSAEDLASLEVEANEMMSSLSRRYDEVGIIRSWKLRDMIFDIDIENKKLRSLTPVDWERTKLDFDKIAVARARLSRE